MKYIASTPEDYINQHPEERQEIIEKLRSTIMKIIPEGFTRRY